MYFNQPFITKKEISLVKKKLVEKKLSKFIGTLTNDTKKILSYSSLEIKNKLPEPSFLGGVEVRGCEYLISNITKRKYSILFNSASSALYSAIKSLGLPSKSKIVVPAVSFSATISAVVAANHIPVICDIDKTTTMSVDSLNEILNKFEIKAVIFVQWCGNQGNIKNIAKLCYKNGIKLIEDSSQATLTRTSHGKYNGTFGDIGIYSFNEPKNLSSGEGGVAVSNNKIYSKAMRLTRNHAEAYQYFKDYNKFKNHISPGYNFRPTEYCAAIIRSQINRRSIINKYRIKNNLMIQKKLKNLLIPICSYKEYIPYSAGYFLSSDWKISKFQLAKILQKRGFSMFTGYPIEHWQLFNDITKKHNLRFLKYYSDKFVCFFQIGFPVSKKNIDDLCNEIIKIFNNQNKYLKISQNKVFSIGRK